MDVQREVSQLVKADRCTVMRMTAYEAIPQWAKKFRNLQVLERDGDTVKARLDTQVMGIPFTAWVTGTWEHDRVVEEIRLSDGTVTREVVVYREVPGGTNVEWEGSIVRFGRLTKLLGPLMGTFFALDVKRDFRRLARHLAVLEPSPDL